MFFEFCRQVCAIESAAANNPQRDVFVLIVAPTGYLLNGNDPIYLQILKSYPNVFFRNLNIPKFVAKNKLVAKWISTGELFASKFLQVHVSDFLRLATLYNFGGVYLDLDFIVVSDLNALESNYFGLELQGASENRTGNSIIDLSDGIGHVMARVILE